MKKKALKKGISLVLGCAMLVGVMCTASFAEEEYVENEWGFVDGSMDVSNGIPEDAPGVWARSGNSES